MICYKGVGCAIDLHKLRHETLLRKVSNYFFLLINNATHLFLKKKKNKKTNYSLTAHFTVANKIQKHKKVWLQMNTNWDICPFAIKSPSAEKLPNTSINTKHLMGFLQNINFLTTNTLTASILPKQWSRNRCTATKILPN